jgi:hypothetical protein
MKSRENTTDGSRWICSSPSAIPPTTVGGLFKPYLRTSHETNFDAPRTNVSSTAQLHSRRVELSVAAFV